MTSISVLEGWGYAVGLLRYLIEALLPGIVVIGELGGPEWLALGVGVFGGLLLVLGVIATLYSVVPVVKSGMLLGGPSAVSGITREKSPTKDRSSPT